MTKHYNNTTGKYVNTSTKTEFVNG